MARTPAVPTQKVHFSLCLSCCWQELANIGSCHLAQLDSAIGTMHEMVALESKFAAAHPDRGFTCSPPDPISMEPDQVVRQLDPHDRCNGYAFHAFGCSETVPVRRFTIVAVPDWGHNPLGCTNESGIVNIDDSDATSACPVP
jgi:hypothetical protein